MRTLSTFTTLSAHKIAGTRKEPKSQKNVPAIIVHVPKQLKGKDRRYTMCNQDGATIDIKAWALISMVQLTRAD